MHSTSGFPSGSMYVPYHDYEETGFLSKKEMPFYEQNSDLSRQSVHSLYYIILLLH